MYGGPVGSYDSEVVQNRFQQMKGCKIVHSAPVSDSDPTSCSSLLNAQLSFIPEYVPDYITWPVSCP